MGQQQSLFQTRGYTLEREISNGFIATKDGERFLITNIKGEKIWKLLKEVETLKETPHPHIVNITETLEDAGLTSCFTVTKFCEGGSLAEKIKERKLEESEALSWFVEICIALKIIHQNNMLHKNVTPENILLTEFGKVCLGGFWKPENSEMNSAISGVHYLPPEVFTDAPYVAKSEIWSLGCVLYELCTQQVPFSAENTPGLIKKIISDPAPRLNESQTTVNYLQTQLDKLREVADNLEKYHTVTTIGSLAGGVIGAAGGITSIVGLILTPFTFGASLTVTGIGVGMGVAGGVTAGASNITNMVSESSNRKAVQSIIKEFDEKVNAVAVWLQEVGHSLESSEEYSSDPLPSEIESSFPGEKQTKAATELGKGLGTVTAAAVRSARVARIGKTAAKASRTVRVAEVATGVLSGLFVAVDIFFIALDAKEIHKIRQTKEDGESDSELLKFVQSVRKSADELQKVLDELKDTIRSIEEAQFDRD